MAKPALIASLFLLSACASDPSYVGRPVADAMLQLGPPAGSMTLPDGRKAYQWRKTRSVGMVLSSGVVATRDKECFLTLAVDERDTVVSQVKPARRC